MCFPYSGTSHNQAYKQQYQRLQHDTGQSCAYRDSPRRHSSVLELAFSTTEYSGTPLDIKQKARVLWQSLSLLSQCSDHVTIPHNFRICMRALCARARVVSHVNGTDIWTLCSPHPLIVNCLLAPPTLCT